MTYFTTARYLPDRQLLEGDSRLREVPTDGARTARDRGGSAKGELVLLTVTVLFGVVYSIKSASGVPSNFSGACPEPLARPLNAPDVLGDARSSRSTRYWSTRACTPSLQGCGTRSSGRATSTGARPLPGPTGP